MKATAGSVQQMLASKMQLFSKKLLILETPYTSLSKEVISFPFMTVLVNCT